MRQLPDHPYLKHQPVNLQLEIRRAHNQSMSRRHTQRLLLAAGALSFLTAGFASIGFAWGGITGFTIGVGLGLIAVAAMLFTWLDQHHASDASERRSDDR